MFTLAELASYLRVALADLDVAAATLLTTLTDGLVTAETGFLSPVPPQAKAVALEVAARAYRNPEGWAAESLDDWSGTRPAALAAAGVYLTEAEQRVLRRIAGGVQSGARSIRLVAHGDQ